MKVHIKYLCTKSAWSSPTFLHSHAPFETCLLLFYPHVSTIMWLTFIWVYIAEAILSSGRLHPWANICSINCSNDWRCLGIRSLTIFERQGSFSPLKVRLSLTVENTNSEVCWERSHFSDLWSCELFKYHSLSQFYLQPVGRGKGFTYYSRQSILCLTPSHLQNNMHLSILNQKFMSWPGTYPL